MKIKIAPSVLSADFGALNSEIKSIEPFSDYLHLDVMDGHFVPNITIGPQVVAALKTSLVKDCHLMIAEPEKYLQAFANAGAGIITIHFEAVKNVSEILQKIRALGVRPSISIKPQTKVEVLLPFLDDVEMVLLMSVEPGFGGQTFMENVLPKISFLRDKKPELDIEVDGGINAESAKRVIAVGANVLVAGTYIFKSADRKAAIDLLKR